MSNNISQASIIELRALTAQHVDRLSKEGRAPVKGVARRPAAKSKDPFERPSPGLIKRLATEARNEEKQRHFQDDAGPSDEQRREILRKKAKRYEAMRRGDFSGLSEKELSESVIDFERWEEDDGYSDHSSDVDESAIAPQSPTREDDITIVEYVDEMGRTRTGTRKEARDAEKLRGHNGQKDSNTSAYAEVLQSNVIHGDQNFFPVYEPDADALRAKYRQAEESARAHHYDATKEVRAKGAGQYQFSLDEEQRAEQMASLSTQREETEKARAANRGLSAAQEAKKRKLDERKALIEAKRAKLFGGQEITERKREERRAAVADDFLQSVERELGT
ncbi:hypothetical protein BCR39DRAFT_514630 [Naematelia encephala]|uniref:Uncharacterized protein n=1 Tax=Naematelia encephala TaxID=71784 RepID=A0A1Y2BJ21_9TREE|nr:hypothetical protein BCR39DRAFT_514630 [Naematelia encephala]